LIKKAFITGVTGQDGSYLTDLLLSKGYQVHGLVRQTTRFNIDNWGHLKSAMLNDQFKVHFGDLTDGLRLRDIIKEIKPDEVYNLGAQSHVGASFHEPANTVNVTGNGCLNVLEAIYRNDLSCKFYQASSSEMFGKVAETPQSETTLLYPRSPYGCAKVFAHNICRNYRDGYGMFTACGILFNHESERRGENFVTRKITRAVGRILAGKQDKLVVGNTNAKRDWGYAPDYVEAMWRMLQQDNPDDFVIGTGEMHSVQEFIDEAFAIAGLESKDFLFQDPSLLRPAEVDILCANASKAKNVLNWEPKVRFKELVRKMTEHDIELAKIETYNER
jgi:GDPmannose 4,6-dehydratase